MSKRPVILILLYILFASLAWGQAQKPPTAPPPLSEKDKKIIALFEKAISLQRAGKAKEAIAAYQELLKLQPNTPMARFNLGEIYLAQGDWKAAETQFRQFVKAMPKVPEGYFRLATVLAQQKQWREATQIAQKGVQLAPNSAEGHFVLGVIYLSQRRYAEAEKSLLRSRQLNPKATNTQFNLAYVYLQMRQPRKAIPILKNLTEQEPKNPAAWAGLGMAYDLAEDLPPARDAYRRALALQPQNEDLTLRLAMVLGRMNQHRESLQLLEKLGIL
jgi:Putative Zn-dependent protease, contains TPR repeats